MPMRMGATNQISGIALMPFDQLLPPLQDCRSWRAALPRAAVAYVFGFAGLRTRLGYAHMCEAGSRWIEGGAALGTPLLAAGCVLFARRLWLGCTAAILLILGVYLLRDPYLTWAHTGMRW
jgi:hypothetical protein